MDEKKPLFSDIWYAARFYRISEILQSINIKTWQKHTLCSRFLADWKLKCRLQIVKA